MDVELAYWSCKDFPMTITHITIGIVCVIVGIQKLSVEVIFIQKLSSHVVV